MKEFTIAKSLSMVFNGDVKTEHLEVGFSVSTNCHIIAE